MSLSPVAGLFDEAETLRKDAAALERALAEKDHERDAVLDLFRRGRIDETTLDQQLDAIEAERAGTKEVLQTLRERIERGPRRWGRGSAPPRHSSRS